MRPRTVVPDPYQRARFSPEASSIQTPNMLESPVPLRMLTATRITPVPGSPQLTVLMASAAPAPPVTRTIWVDIAICEVADPDQPPLPFRLPSPYTKLSKKQGGSAAAVVKLHTGPVVVPELLTSSIRQKYVVLLTKVPGLYVVAV